MDMRWVLSLLVGGPMALTTTFLVYQAWAGQKQALSARQWPETTGFIITAQVTSSRVRIRRSSSTGYRMATSYRPHVVYRYQVNGVGYEGEQLHLGETIGYSGTGPVETILTRYPVGVPVRVYYNPDNPTEATLSPKTGWATTIYWLISALLFFMTVMVVYAIISNGP